MRERPIILRAHEVRGILAGRVTQVRRLVLHKGALVHHGREGGSWHRLYDDLWYWCREDDGEPLGSGIRCPFGLPGNRLWVRETWGASYVDLASARPHAVGGTWGSPARPGRKPCVVYRADDPSMPDDSPGETARWSPSIHMPRWASRITLEITDVRVERVQEISDDDIRTEGTEEWVRAGGVVYAPRDGFDGQCADDSGRIAVKPNRVAFASLWNEAYAKRGLGWDANPWVWVVEFRRVEGEQ